MMKKITPQNNQSNMQNANKGTSVMAARAAGMAASLLVRPGTSVTLPDDAPGALVVASLRDLLALLD